MPCLSFVQDINKFAGPHPAKETLQEVPNRVASLMLDHKNTLLTYRQIQIIEAIAEHGSIGQAAEALHMSQPAVTRALQQIEDMLEVKLFDRTPNGVMPTVFAEPILKHAKSIHIAMRETKRELQVLKTPSLKQLSVGSGIHSTEIWVNRAVALLALADHDAKITVDRYDWNDLLTHLQAGAVDYGLGEIGELQDDQTLNIEPVAELDLHFVCGAGHPLAQKSDVSAEHITQYPMVGNKLARPIAAHFRDHIGQLGQFDSHSGGIFSAIRVTSLNAIKLALTASDAVSVMPLDSIRSEVQSGQLVALDRSNMPWLIGRIGFIASKSRVATPLMKAFRNAVLDVEIQRRNGPIRNA